MSHVAVLFLIFNRPDTTARVMQTIRRARPSRLYVAADGPRDRPGEAELCQEARRIATAVEWPCEVRTLFHDSNLGCRNAVSSGISWFFEHEPEGIVLEDDCLPTPSFFRFCAELLDYYRNEARVMCITGNNFQEDMGDYPCSYYFSKYNHVWGWASWRRAWNLYDLEMAAFPRFSRSGALDSMSATPGFSQTWEKTFKKAYRGEIDTWDYQWQFACWLHKGATCTPRTNLVSNIGFRPDATHTRDAESASANLPAGELEFPLNHPPEIAIEEQRDAYVDVTQFGVRPSQNKARWGRRVENAVKGALRTVGLRAY